MWTVVAGFLRKASQFPPAISSSAARPKRQQIVTTGATLPSWNLIASQVEPQIRTPAL
jgi:hypothetical protein